MSAELAKQSQPVSVMEVLARAAANPRVARKFQRLFTPEPNSGCWLWTGALNSCGYGSFRDGPTRVAPVRGAHVVSYEIYIGPVPDGLQLDHLCRVRSCVNPYHLEPVTQAENMRRGVATQRSAEVQRNKTHCPYGHEYAGANLYVFPDGKHRGCRACHAANSLARYRRLGRGK